MESLRDEVRQQTKQLEILTGEISAMRIQLTQAQHEAGCWRAVKGMVVVELNASQEIALAHSAPDSSWLRG